MKKYNYLAIIDKTQQSFEIEVENGNGLSFKIDKKNNIHIYSYIFNYLPLKKIIYIINNWDKIFFNKEAYKEFLKN